MALTLAGVQGSRQQLGNMWIENYLIVPGTSDYVTNGYLIGIPGTASANGYVSMSLIQGVQVVGANATVVGPPTYFGFPVFTFQELGTGGAGVVGYKSFLFQVNELTTVPAYGQAGSGANLTGCIWEIAVTGF